MKKSNLLIICVLVIALLAMPVSAYTHYFYLFNHGTMARTEGGEGEGPINPDISSVHNYGWGHRTVLNAGSLATPTGAWVDLPVTGVASYDGTHPLVRYAHIQMRSETSNGGIARIDVYNGHTKVKQLDVDWYSSPSDTWEEFTVDLGNYYDFQRGMNMDVWIKNVWDETRYNEIGGYGAKAEW